MEEEVRALIGTFEDAFLGIEAMEQRLQMQTMNVCLADAALCVWFVCTDVCPPGG
jgi:hypothetical protein